MECDLCFNETSGTDATHTIYIHMPDGTKDKLAVCDAHYQDHVDAMYLKDAPTPMPFDTALGKGHM